MLKRLPSFNQTLSAYAVIAFMLFAWALLWFFWNIPSWIKFMTLGYLLATLSYPMAASFLESLTILVLLLIPAMILPAGWFRERFAARGSAVTIGLLGVIMLRDYLIVADYFFLKPLPIFWLTSALLTALLLFLAVKFQRMEKALTLLAERLTIFLYIFVPLSVISLLAILVRNITL
jgi:hypothetical protein